MDLGTSITRILFLKQIGFWMKATAFPRPPLALQPTDVQMSSDKGVKEVHATVGSKNGSAQQNCAGDGSFPWNRTSHCVGACSDGCACIGSLRPLRRGSPVSGREYSLRGRPRGRDKGRPGNSGR